MRDVVRPNFDTLYSVAWLDLTKGPVMLSAPDTKGRYYLLPLMDMWTDVFAVPGKRTSGTSAADFVIVPQHWKGRPPSGARQNRSADAFCLDHRPHANQWTEDYDAVHEVQNGYKISPLSRWGKSFEPVAVKIDSSVDMKTPPAEQVNSMPAAKFFAYAAELMKVNPPHVTDWSQVERLKRIGLEAGRSFDFDKADPNVKRALEMATSQGLATMKQKAPTLAPVVNGWQMNISTMGVYGDYYLKRAIVAMVGLGANQPEDAIYPLNLADDQGKPLDGAHNYVLHFGKE